MIRLWRWYVGLYRSDTLAFWDVGYLTGAVLSLGIIIALEWWIR